MLVKSYTKIFYFYLINILGHSTGHLLEKLEIGETSIDIYKLNKGAPWHFIHQAVETDFYKRIDLEDNTG